MSTDRVRVQFDADTSRLSSGVSRAKSMLGGLGSAAKGIAAGVGGALALGIGIFAAYAKGVAKDMDRIGDLAKRFGLTAESMQRLQYAAQQSGTDVETLATGLQRAIIAGQKAAAGSRETAAAFAALGISAAQFNSATQEQKLAMIADGYANAADEGKALQAVIAIMGRGAGELIPMLKEGGDVLTKTMSEAAVASNKAVANMQRLDDAWMKFKGTAAAVTAEILNYGVAMFDVMSGKKGGGLPQNFGDFWAAVKQEATKEVAPPIQKMDTEDIESVVDVAERNPIQTVVASSMAKIGAGGGVFGGGKANPTETLKSMKGIMTKQLAVTESMERKIGPDSMQP